MKLKNIIVFILALAQSFSFGQSIDLSGIWRFEFDSKDLGIQEKWFSRNLTDSISLPGSTISQGKGEKPSSRTKWIARVENSIYYKNPEYAPYRDDNNFKVPFFLQPETYYQGAAWYQKTITITDEMAGKPLQLFMERCHWQSTVWIDSLEIGSCNALGAPHTLYIKDCFSAGNHTLTIRVDNRIHDIIPGPNAHSVSDHTQGNWNGIVGDISLKAMPLCRVDSLKVFSDLNSKTLNLRMNIKKEQKQEKDLTLTVEVFGNKHTFAISRSTIDFDCQIPFPENPIYWDEFNPHLYPVNVYLTDKKLILDTKSINIGLRSISNKDGVLTINGHPGFMRGTLNCASFPKTGYPATDKAEWIREFSICKNYGLNHIRFHSWCPPEAAFDAADELGLYLYIECSSWSEDIGSGKAIDSYIYEEANRILYNFGNHPSFCFVSYGNEPGGKQKDEYLENFVSHLKATENRMMIATAGGWPQLDINDFQCDYGPRIQHWGEGTRSIINSHQPSSDYNWYNYCKKFKQPVISHEVGQWCVFPNFKEIKEYTGPYKARNFEIFQDLLIKHGLGHLADSFHMASGKLQTLCYKADIEAALRTRNQGGYELLGLQDFSGQGSALIGALDVFWNEKEYTSGREYREFQNSLVPLAVMKKFIFNNNEYLEARIQLANYYKELKDKSVSWSIKDDEGKTVNSGSFPLSNCPIGNVFNAGTIKTDLSKYRSPSQYRLEISVEEFINHWDFWVYPSEVSLELDDIYMTDTLDKEAVDKLKQGGKVFLSIKKGNLSTEFGGDIPVGFSSIFWNTDWTNGQDPYTLGILCNPNHKAFSKFPTQYHSNYQWFDAMTNSGAIRLDKLNYKGTPIVRIIDDWFTSRPIALILEAKAYNGKIIISGIDFFNNINNRLAGKQLLHSLLEYMKSDNFTPSETIDIEAVSKL